MENNIKAINEKHQQMKNDKKWENDNIKLLS